MKNLIIASLLVFYVSLYANAQTSAPSSHTYIISKLQQPEINQGTIQIIQDKRIDELLSKVTERNARKGTVRGYRIQIFRENSQVAQSRAQAARSKFMSKFPEIEAYTIPKSPFWSVYVGDFRTLNDAYRMLKQIDTVFPNAFIRPEDLDYNKF